MQAAKKHIGEQRPFRFKETTELAQTNIQLQFLETGKERRWQTAVDERIVGSQKFTIFVNYQRLQFAAGKNFHLQVDIPAIFELETVQLTADRGKNSLAEGR